MITVRTVRIFFITLVLTFMMAIAPRLVPKQILVNPLPLPKKIDILEKVKPKLKKMYPNFHLKLPVSFAPTQDDFEKSAAYGVMDFDSGEVIASKNLSSRLPIASLTKIMTAVVALDLASPDTSFPVSPKAARQIPTKVMLKAGERYSLEELLKFALMASANDSVEVIKEGIDAKFGEGVFVSSMNYKAEVLGLKNTHFANVQGFDNWGNFSTVEDLMLLSHYAITNYPLIAEIVKKDHEDLTDNGSDLRFFVNNWNGLLGVYPGVTGIKIGNTEKGGYTTVVLSEREGKKVLAVVLGAPGVLERDFWTANLLDLGFSKIAGLLPINITEGQLKQKYASWKYFQ